MILTFSTNLDNCTPFTNHQKLFSSIIILFIIVSPWNLLNCRSVLFITFICTIGVLSHSFKTTVLTSLNLDKAHKVIYMNQLLCQDLNRWWQGFLYTFSKYGRFCAFSKVFIQPECWISLKFLSLTLLSIYDLYIDLSLSLKSSSATFKFIVNLSISSNLVSRFCKCNKPYILISSPKYKNNNSW